MYLDGTALQAIELLHDVVTCNVFAQCLSCVVKFSSFRGARCDWQQPSSVLDRDLSVYLGKGGPESTWSLTSRLHETNHGKSTQHIIAEGAGAGHLGAQHESHLNRADLHKASREAAPCRSCGKVGLRILTSLRCLV